MATYRLDVVSLAPQAFASLLELGVIGRAFSAGIAELHLHNPRDFATDRYRKVDDEPYGGGAGMVLKPEPVFAAVESVPRTTRSRVLLMSPQGRPLQQADLQRWASEHDQLLLLCGHYEGFDERIRSLADEEVSAGDFVLTGGRSMSKLSAKRLFHPSAHTPNVCVADQGEGNIGERAEWVLYFQFLNSISSTSQICNHSKPSQPYDLGSGSFTCMDLKQKDAHQSN